MSPGRAGWHLPAQIAYGHPTAGGDINRVVYCRLLEYIGQVGEFAGIAIPENCEHGRTILRVGRADAPCPRVVGSLDSTRGG